MPPRRNLELKAHDPDPPTTLRAALALGAEDEGTLHQRDTYFPAPRGRLKLREQTPGGAALIQYERTDAPQERESAYRIVPVADPRELAAALEPALGTDVVVVKRRRLLLWEGVRIHLDDVMELGTFVELEAVLDEDGALDDAQPRIDHLRGVLGITDERLEPRGYAEQLRLAGSR
jgi:predicted adenylyl cyclase CyaB